MAKGQNKGSSPQINVLLEKIASLESELAVWRQKELVRCGLCNGDGIKLKQDGTPFTDGNECPVACENCNGSGRVRV